MHVINSQAYKQTERKIEQNIQHPEKASSETLFPQRKSFDI